MSWLSVEIEVDGSTISGWSKNNQEFTLPFSSNLEVGGHFKVGEKSFVAESVTNVAGRGEQLLIGGKEVQNDKPKARRNKSNAGGQDVSVQDQYGHNNED